MTNLNDDIEYFEKRLCYAMGIDYEEFKKYTDEGRPEEQVVDFGLLDYDGPLKDLYLQKLEQARIQLRVKGLLV